MLKKVKDKIFYYLVESNPNILNEYQQYRWNNEEFHKKNRLKSWLYLGNLNLKYRYLKLPNQINRESYKNNIYKLPYLDGAESDLVSRPAPHHLAFHLLSYEIISFDIFDTLIFKPFNDPKALFMLLGERHNYMGFADIRIQAEIDARNNAQNKENREVTIYDIYEVIEYRTGINKDYGIQVEYETELDLCFENPYMKRVFQILKTQEKKIIAVSDIYWPKDYINKYLEKCGYEGFDEVYVSCEYNCSKRDGYLYKTILKKYGKTKGFIHVGDDYATDIQKAKLVGLDTSYYENVHNIGANYRPDSMSDLIGAAYSGIVNTHLHNGIKKYSPYYEYGFIYGGIYVFGYCNWIYNYVKHNKIDKVLFLSQDGDILQKIFNMLFDMPNEYVYWSRIANAKYTASKNKYDFFEELFVHKTHSVDISIDSLLSSYGLSFLVEKLKDYDLSKTEIIHSGNLKLLERLVVDNWVDIIDVYKEEVVLAQRYFENIIGQSQKIAIVDGGWVGSEGEGLKFLIEKEWNMDCQVSVLVAASKSTNPTENLSKIMKHEIEAYIFSRIHNRELYDFHSNTNEGSNNIYFEIFTQSCSPSFLGYEVDGKCEFKYDSPELENYGYLDEIHNGIMEFSGLYRDHFKNYSYMYNIPGNDAYQPFKMIVSELSFIRKYFSTFLYSREDIGDFENKKTEKFESIIENPNS